MNLNIEEFDIKNSCKCECGREFDIHDITDLRTLNQHGFYGNVIKNYSYTQCPACHRDAVLLLKQKGQTWEVLCIAVPKVQAKVVKQVNIVNNKTINDTVDKVTDGLTCSICGKACKSKTGLTAHMRTHNK